MSFDLLGRTQGQSHRQTSIDRNSLIHIGLSTSTRVSLGRLDGVILCRFSGFIGTPTAIPTGAIDLIRG
jgi:hypothetical protein